MSKKKKEENMKICLVLGASPERFEMGDTRLMKPLCHHQLSDDKLSEGAMLTRDIDKVSLSKKSNITYFIPNNIALLLSVSEKALNTAKKIYTDKFSKPEIPLDLDKMEGDRIKMMYGASSLVCDYLESIQTSIVFGYTALEAFVNLSIPEDYTYTTDKNNKGISEIFDKKAIERWVPLKTKVKIILTDIYGTKRIEKQKWWGHFLSLENYRNDIIHQKSISHTEFYKVYFKQIIFDVCKSPSHLIQFFYESHAEDKRTNPIWPWMEGIKILPAITFESRNFEIVGNMYEGIKKKRQQ